MRLFLPLALLLTACPPSPPPAPAPPDPAQVEPPPQASPSPTSPPDTTSQALPAWPGAHGHMKEHLIHLEQGRQALLRGDLAQARQALSWLGAHEAPGDLPEGWRPHVAAMRDAAVRGASSEDLAFVADSVAAVADQCGSCHTAMGAMPSFIEPPAPVAAAGSKGHMKRHAWAAERMWEGLIQPSEDRWTRGVAMLREHPLQAADEAPLPASVTSFAQRVHDLGVDGADPPDAATRVALYGDFLVQCAACHTASGVRPE